MQRKILFTVALITFFAFAVTASASHAPTNLRIVRDTAKSVTIGWNPVSGVTGYGLFVDGVRVSTAGPTATQAKFGTPETRQYVLGVSALKTGGGTSTITVQPRWTVVSVNIPPEPPPDPSGDQVPATIPADCSQDVTGALQAWLDSRPDGATLVFPSGSCYRSEGVLTLNGRTGITLQGTGSTLRATTVGDGHRPNIRLQNGNNLTVKGFRLEGGYTTPGTHNEAVQWSHGVEVLGTQTVLVEDVTAVNMGGDCVYLGLGTQRTRDATVRRLTCTGIGRNGVSLVAADRSRVEQSSVTNVGYVSFDVEPNSGAGFGVDTATITGNTIGAYQINAFTIVGDAPISNISFTSNQVTSSLGARIQVTGLPRRTNITISGNTATATLNYPQAIRLDNVDGAVVTNNSLPTTGVELRCASVTALTFTGNTPNTQAGCTTTPAALTLTAVDGGSDYYAQFTNPLPSSTDYFPIGVWGSYDHTQANRDLDAAAGLNTYVWAADNTYVDDIRADGRFRVIQDESNRTNTGTETAGWLTQDELDMRCGPPGCDGYTQLENQIQGMNCVTRCADGRFLYANYGKGVMFWETDAQAAQWINGTAGFGRYQDLVSDDIYWMTDPNERSTPGYGLPASYGKTVDRMRFLDGMDGSRKPIWNFVETGWPFTESATAGGRAILPAELRAAVWHSLIAGARGIIYFQHSFGGPHTGDHHTIRTNSEGTRAAVVAVDAQVKSLASVLNSPTVTSGVTVSGPIRVMVKWNGSNFYVFAGSTGTAGTGTVSIPCVGSATASVLGESGGTRTVTSGSFTDTFADKNAVHVYRIDGGSRCGL